MSSEEITLEIEGTSVKCKKDELASNSDYFKVMFEGNFVEKNKNFIQLKDVDLKAMNIILTLIWDETYYIEDEDVLMVLQTACMLQFVKIQNICVDKIVEILTVRNCLKVWIITEQLDLKTLYLKAKSMALTEFMAIKDTDSILELTLKQLSNYLGNINLKTDNELSVFQTVMHWWYENNNGSKKELLKLLSCIDYKSLLPDHFKEILIYPGIVSTEFEKILKCVYNINNRITSQSFSEEIVNKAVLLNTTKNRVNSCFPCILVQTLSSENDGNSKLFTNDEDDDENDDDSNDDLLESILLTDKYKRSRSFQILHPNKYSSWYVVLFDHRSNKFETFLPLKETLEGFKLIGYKEYVFMYGGEYTLGRGDWNRGFWAYDTVKERWQRKATLPFPRRHFETCMVDSKIFIVGGTGLYRINQENIFWYDFKEDTWSNEKSLPVFDRNMKCCNFMNKLFLFSIANSCGYFFEQGVENWIAVPIKIEKSLLNNGLEYTVFPYKNKLYIKGKKLVELVMADNELHVSSITDVTDKSYCKIETVICNNVAFTLYELNTIDTNNSAFIRIYFSSGKFSLESFNLDTGDIDFIFEDLNFVDAGQTRFAINETLNMFQFKHYSLMEGDDLVNDCL